MAHPKKSTSKKTALTPATQPAVETTPEVSASSQPAATSSPKDSSSSQKIKESPQPKEIVEEEIPAVDVSAPLQIEQKRETAPVEEIIPEYERSNKMLYFLGIAFASAIISFSFLFFYLGSKSDMRKPQTMSGTLTVKPPTATATQLLSTYDKTKIEIEVLNGSGIAGAAQQAAEKLKALGFTQVSTGNADSSNYQKTHVLLSEDLIEFVDDILDDLAPSFTDATTAGQLENATSSARIIIGK